MEKKILNYQYSIFGEFREFYDNISKYLESFKDFNKEILKDVLQPGIEFPCYKFSNDEITIMLHFDRIDLSFNDITSNDTEKIKKYLELFIDKISVVNRLAINFNYLYQDKDFKILNKIASTSLLSKKENLKEFLLRKNNTFIESNVEFNDIVIIQNGSYQDKKTFELIDSMIFQYDINTVVGKIIETKIEKSRVLEIFDIILKKLISEDNEINSYLKE